VARPTRSQRRARREQQAEQQQAATPRARARQQPSSSSVQPAEREAPPRREAREPPAREGGFLNFVRESYAELKKVEWPGQRQVMTGTIVVIVACLIVGGYLWIADLVVKRVVQNVFLGQ
jgi:preprotein translocase subunit SecE